MYCVPLRWVGRSLEGIAWWSLATIATLNGYSCGETPGITLTVGQGVRWFVMGSTNVDVDAPHRHGNLRRPQRHRTGQQAADANAGDRRRLAGAGEALAAIDQRPVGELHRKSSSRISSKRRTSDVRTASMYS